MKELFINIITKIIDYTKIFIAKIVNNIKFECNKNLIIKVMYSPILEKKKKERNNLLSEFNNVKQQREKLNREINMIKEENRLYNKKIDSLNSFQQFLLNSQN